MTVSNLTQQELSNVLALASQKGAFAYGMEQFAGGEFNNSILPSDVKAPAGAGIRKLFENSAEGKVKSFKEVFNNDTAAQFGANFNITALSQLAAGTIKQKFYLVEELNKFVPMDMGANPFAPTRVFIKEFYGIQNPEGGLISPVNKGQYQEVETGVDSTPIDREFWAKQISYNFLQQSQLAYLGQSGYDYVKSKLEALNTDYELFMRKILFYGFSKKDNTGLLTSTEVTTNTSLITKKISEMTSTEINAFVRDIITVYQANQVLGEFPDTFFMPQSDYTGMGALINPDFPLAGSTKLAFLLETFKIMTNNPNFKIVTNFYAQKSWAANAQYKKANGSAPLSYDRYMLYKNRSESLVFDLPIPFTMLGTGTLNNFDYLQLGYAQVGKTFFKRPADAIYFDNTNS